MIRSNKRVSRRRVLSGIAAGGALALAGRAPAFAQGAQKIAFIEPFDLALEYMHEMNGVVGGHFQKQGLDVEITNARGTAIGLQQVIAKQAIVTRVGALDLMKADASQPVPLISIATSLQDAIFSVISLKSAPINSPADMRGKTIGVASMGGGHENTLNLLLASAGIPVSDVPRQAIGSSAGNVELLKQGRVNAFFATVENSIALLRAKEPVTIWSAGKFAPMPGGAIVTRRDFGTENKETTIKFLRGMYASALECLSADPNKILDRIEKKYDLAAQKARDFRIEAIKAYNGLATSQGRENLLRNVPGVWAKAAELTNKAGLVKVADAVKLYSNEYIDAARKT